MITKNHHIWPIFSYKSFLILKFSPVNWSSLNSLKTIKLLIYTELTFCNDLKLTFSPSSALLSISSVNSTQILIQLLYFYFFIIFGRFLCWVVRLSLFWNNSSSRYFSELFYLDLVAKFMFTQKSSLSGQVDTNHSQQTRIKSNLVLKGHRSIICQMTVSKRLLKFTLQNKLHKCKRIYFPECSDL